MVLFPVPAVIGCEFVVVGAVSPVAGTVFNACARIAVFLDIDPYWFWPVLLLCFIRRPRT